MTEFRASTTLVPGTKKYLTKMAGVFSAENTKKTPLDAKCSSGAKKVTYEDLNSVIWA